MENPFNHSAEYLEYLNSLPKEFFLRILEHLYLGVYVSDRDGNTVYANPAITRHYGKRPEELVTYSNWGIWQGIVSPPAYKEVFEKKRTLFYRQMHFFPRKFSPPSRFPFWISTRISTFSSVSPRITS